MYIAHCVCVCARGCVCGLLNVRIGHISLGWGNGTYFLLGGCTCTMLLYLVLMKKPSSFVYISFFIFHCVHHHVSLPFLLSSPSPSSSLPLSTHLFPLLPFLSLLTCSPSSRSHSAHMCRLYPPHRRQVHPKSPRQTLALKVPQMLWLWHVTHGQVLLEGRTSLLQRRFL